MWWLIAILAMIDAVSVWSLRQKTTDRDLRKQVGFLALASSFVSFLLFLLMLFDFLEAKQRDYISLFISDGTLVSKTAALMLMVGLNGVIAAVAFRKNAERHAPRERA